MKNLKSIHLLFTQVAGFSLFYRVEEENKNQSYGKDL